jgi:hypothetical protein
LPKKKGLFPIFCFPIRELEKKQQNKKWLYLKLLLTFIYSSFSKEPTLQNFKCPSISLQGNLKKFFILFSSKVVKIGIKIISRTNSN